jgi:hypothetical protein
VARAKWRRKGVLTCGRMWANVATAFEPVARRV